MTEWIDPVSPDESLHGSEGLHALVRRTLARRGLSTPESVRAFLDPDAYAPSPASDLPGMAAAVDRIRRAIEAGEPICVWGDFDVDGQTSTTILVQALQLLDANVTYHIPVRAHESHGVHVETLAGILDRGASLILTCDTGISSHEAAAYARSRGVDMLITDHHDLPDELPAALAIVNPKLLDSAHPLATLSGAGVAYKLAEALLDDGPRTMDDGPQTIVHGPSSLLDLAALGLVADLAILRGDARYLVQRGLRVLRDPQRLGLKVMMEMAELNPANLSEEHIGFVLGPRLNALGRLGDANPAVELLTTSNPERARLIAAQLENYNAQRQLLSAQVTEAAEAQLRADPALLAQPIIILAHPAWPGGVIGIVASRLVDRYHKPAILFSSPEGQPARGSARSIDGLHITEAIAANRDLLLGFGGHPMAAGLALDASLLPDFRRRMAKTVAAMLGPSRPEPRLEIDGWLELPEITLDLAAAIEQLAPFGPGNERLVLAGRGLSLQSAATIGRNKEHRKLTVRDEVGNTQQVLWWDGADAPQPEGKFDLAFTLRTSDYRGVRQVQLELVDFRVVEAKIVEIETLPRELVDYRGLDDPLGELQSRRESFGLIWAEGDDRKRTGGRDRHGLEPAPILTVWTAPPSLAVLHDAIERVGPGRIVWVALDPGTDSPRAFLERLAGLAKFIINQRGGHVSESELAASTAQTTEAVRDGLAWMTAQGQLVVASGPGGGLTLALGDSDRDEVEAARLAARLQTILAESAAYRAYLRKATLETVL